MTDQEVIYYAVVVTCILSVIGASFIIVSFLLSAEFRKSQSRRLLFLLSICDLVVALAYLLFNTYVNPVPDPSNPPPLCKAQAVINIFGNQASFFWTDFISLFLFISRKYGIRQASKFIPLFHIISWGWPTISVSLVIWKHTWGLDQGATADWCWIARMEPQGALFAWHLIAGKAVEMASCIFITVMYIFVFFDLRKKVDQSPATQLLITHRTGGNSWKNTEKKLLAIPFIFVILRTSGTVRTVYEYVHGRELDSQFLAVMQAIGDSGQGLANGVLFGLFTSKVRTFYQKLLAKCSFSSSHDKTVNYYGDPYGGSDHVYFTSGSGKFSADYGK